MDISRYLKEYDKAVWVSETERWVFNAPQEALSNFNELSKRVVNDLSAEKQLGSVSKEYLQERLGALGESIFETLNSNSPLEKREESIEYVRSELERLLSYFQTAQVNY